jgi:TetR/AcrR family transcriptional repressor of nem operon
MSNTRIKILDVADDLVQRVGLNAMSYKHISDAVGIRKASIHHHFPKKENLVDQLLERCAISYGDRYKQIVKVVDWHLKNCVTLRLYLQRVCVIRNSVWLGLSAQTAIPFTIVPAIFYRTL